MSITATATAARDVPTLTTWTRPRTSVAAPLALLAATAIVLVHLVAIGTVDPIAQAMSLYGVHPESAGLFAVGCTALGAACVQVGGQLPGPGRWSAYGAGAMLVLVVVAPTDVGDGPLSISAQIHRYAAGAAFVLMACMMVAALRRTGSGRGVLVGLLAVVVVVLTLTIVGTFAPQFLAMSHWRGVPQRILLVDYAVAVVVIGRGSLVGATRTREPAARPAVVPEALSRD